MNLLLTTLNAKYIHKNLALRWLYVANQNRYDVDIKEYTIKQDLTMIVEELANSPYDVIAFSVYIWNIEPTIQIIKALKQRCEKHIIVGGPEVSYEYEGLLEIGVDAISLGEGEKAFWEYMDCLDQHLQREVIGIYTKEFPNQHFAYVDLAYNESLPSPYFLDMDKNDMQNRYFYMETSRGCPYACEYCLSSVDSKVRLYSENYVFKILETLSTSKVRIVKLLDRTFNIHPKRALKIARYMNEHCPNQIFQFEVVAETLSDELLDFFCLEADKKRFRFEIGIQSFHEKTLDAVGRLQDNKRLVEVIHRFQEAGVVMHADLIAGLPYEDFAQFKNSFNTLYDLHVSEIQLGILKLLKGTKLKEKQALYQYTYNEVPPYDVTSTAWLHAEELRLIHMCAHAVDKFYNSGMLRYTIDHILDLAMYPDAFTLFCELGKKLALLSHPYQPQDVFKLVKEVCREAEAIIDGLLYYDYFKIFKQRPKLFLGNKIGAAKRKEIGKMCIAKGIVAEEALYHYGHIDVVYYHHELGYQLILYSKEQAYPKRWFINERGIEVMI